MENEVITTQPSEVKEVEFHGDKLLAINQLDKIYVAARWVSQGIGFTQAQSRRHVMNLQTDEVLKQGVAVLRLPTNGGVQDVLCIELDFLPLWLAKINITPTMRRTNPEGARKMVDYQLKAKEVLSQAFIRKQTPAEVLLAQAEFLVETERMMNQMKERQDQQQAMIDHQQQQIVELTARQLPAPATPIRSDIVHRVQVLARYRGTSVQEAWHEVYWVLNNEHGIDIGARLKKKHKDINEERVRRGKREYSENYLKQKINGMDIIMEQELAPQVIEVIESRMLVRG